MSKKKASKSWTKKRKERSNLGSWSRKSHKSMLRDLQDKRELAVKGCYYGETFLKSLYQTLNQKEKQDGKKLLEDMK